MVCIHRQTTELAEFQSLLQNWGGNPHRLQHSSSLRNPKCKIWNWNVNESERWDDIGPQLNIILAWNKQMFSFESIQSISTCPTSWRKKICPGKRKNICPEFHASWKQLFECLNGSQSHQQSIRQFLLGLRSAGFRTGHVVYRITIKWSRLQAFTIQWTPLCCQSSDARYSL